MKKEDAVTKIHERLVTLRLQEKQLLVDLKQMSERIRNDVKPSSILKSAVSGAFKNKTTMAETATAALGLGAGLVARTVVRSHQRKLGLAGKAAGLAAGFLINRFLQKKKER
jgi:hypothetical protein